MKMNHALDFVKDVMDPDPCIVADSVSLAEVMEIMVKKDAKVVILTSDDQKLVGIYTETDLANAFMKKVKLDTPMTKLMTKYPKFVTSDQPVEKCIEIMSTLKFRNLPVVRKDRVIGMVGVLDLQKVILKKQKHQVEMLRLRDEYLGVVAHDVRSPIGTIKTCIEVLEMNEAVEPIADGQRVLLDSMKDNVETTLGLVSDLLDIRRLNDGMKLEIKEASLKNILQEICNNARFKAGEKEIVIRYLDKTELFADIDEKRYVEIVRNLLDNAIKFSPNKGEIKVWSEIDSDNQLMVSIKDQGPGIPEDKVETIFGEYNQISGDAKQLGFGLGLSIAMQFAKLHRGRVEISETGKSGTTFSVITPCARFKPTYSKV